MPKPTYSDDDTPDLLVVLKQPPVSSGQRTLISILEDGGSLEDFPFSLEPFIAHEKFVYSMIRYCKQIKDVSIARTHDHSVSPSFKVPELIHELILERLNAFLLKVSEHSSGKIEPEKILGLLPYWPYTLRVFDLLEKEALKNVKQWNKSRWTNTLRDLQKEDCPLGNHTRSVAIAQYRMALALIDEIKDIHRMIKKWVAKTLGASHQR
jgi:hypothetical protein